MTKLQKVYVKQDEACVSGAVDTIELPKINPISAIILHWHFETGAGESAALANEAVIEVIKNGSEVLASLQYGQCVGIDQLFHPAEYKIADLGESATGDYYCFIPFGRFIGDTEYFLDPRTFAGLDLKITQPTHTASVAANYDVILVRFLEPYPTSKGHFRITTKREYTSAAATEYIELDRAYPYGAIMISELDGSSTDILSVIDSVKVNVDAGAWYPIDEKAPELFAQESIKLGYTLGNALETPRANTNMLICNWMKPWTGEAQLLQAPKFGDLKLEVTGLAAGTIRVTGVQLAK